MGVNYKFYKLALATGTCHLPLQGLNHELLHLLIFKPTPPRPLGPERNSVESRIEALCTLGKTSRTGLQTVRYSQEPIL